MPHVQESADKQQEATIEIGTQVNCSRSERLHLIDAAGNSSSEFPSSVKLAPSGQKSHSSSSGGHLTSKVETTTSTTSTSSARRSRLVSAGRGAGEPNNNEPAAANRNEQPRDELNYKPQWPFQLAGLKIMDSSSRALANRQQQQQQQQQMGNGKASQSPQSAGSLNQLQQTSSIPSYNSIFSTPQQQPKATNLDEEILGKTSGPTSQPAAQANSYAARLLPTVAAPSQKQAWPGLGSAQRAPLKKQTAAADSKRLLVFNYERPSKQQVSYASEEDESASGYNENGADPSATQTEEDDDDDDDDESTLNQDTELLEERLGAYGNMQKRAQAAAGGASENRRHTSGGRAQSSVPLSAKHQQQQVSAKNAKLHAAKVAPLRSSQRQNSIKRADSVQMSGGSKKGPAAPHTKISFHEQQTSASCKRLDMLEQAAYLNCECAACAKKRKLAGFVQGHGSAPSLAAPVYYTHHQQQHSPVHHLAAVGELSKSALLVESGRYPKTRIMHLILKSIILVLCTLLLLLLLVGTAMLANSLPGAVDKITNVSRSFNVTIAGRR